MPHLWEAWAGTGEKQVLVHCSSCKNMDLDLDLDLDLTSIGGSLLDTRGEKVWGGELGVCA